MIEDSNNHRAFDSKKAVALYTSTGQLQKPEETILRLLQTELPSPRILDIGVGGGRTTRYLAAWAREYVGIDYSEGMIDACREKFKNSINVRFLLCDARCMQPFTDEYFDLVVFSFNGLDYVGHEDRIRILGEVKRVLRRGGEFMFSSHNLRSAPSLFGHFPMSPPRMPLHEWLFAPIRNAKRRILNPGWIGKLQKDFAILNDGAFDWRLTTYYVRPYVMLNQLLAVGFRNVRVFSLDGTEIRSTENVRLNRDRWLYYLCQAMI